MVEFQASLDNLEKMMLYIRKEANKYNVDEKVCHKIELACEEALVNIISYAYSQKKGRLRMACSKFGERFEVTIRDYGDPFNPIEFEVDPQLEKSVQTRKIGGLGIFLMRKTIDEASYHRQGEENVLRLAFSMALN